MRRLSRIACAHLQKKEKLEKYEKKTVEERGDGEMFRSSMRAECLHKNIKQTTIIEESMEGRKVSLLRKF